VETEKAPLTLSELNEVQQELMDKYTDDEFADFLSTIMRPVLELPMWAQIQKRLRGRST